MTDIRQTDDGDIDLITGDFEQVEPTGQHQRDILIAAPGDYKESPPVGVDSIRNILDVDPAAYLRTIRKQLAADGQKVNSVGYNENTGKVDIDAEYEDS